MTWKQHTHACDAGSGFRRMGKELTSNLRKWRGRRTRGHDLQRTVDTNGEMLVWCRKCFGHDEDAADEFGFGERRRGGLLLSLPKLNFLPH